MSEHDSRSALAQLLVFCETAERRLAEYGMSAESIAANDDQRDLLLMPIAQIGEIAYKNKSTFQMLCPDIPWDDVAGMRHIIVHDYYSVDPVVVFDTATIDIPALKSACKKVLA